MKYSTLKKSKIFYGWWIVAAVLLISGYNSGVIFFGFTALFEPIAKEFGWSYAKVSLAASIRGFETSLIAPVIGMIMDRWGPRKLVFAGATVTGLGLLLLSRSTSLPMMYVAFIVMSFGSSASGGMLLTAVVGHWFRRRISLALSIALCGSAFGGLLVPLITRIIDKYEWQQAVVFFGLGTWLFILPLSFLLRHKPEQYGYLPDGDIGREPVSTEGLAAARSTMENTESRQDIGVGRALRSRPFWHISFGCVCHILIAVAVITHVMPYLSSIGVSRSTSSLATSAIALAGILGRLSFGWLGDRYDRRKIAAFSFFPFILSLLVFNYIDIGGVWLLILFVILFGIGWGGIFPMQPALLADYFGRAKLGTMLGFSLGIAMLGNIVGPPLAGWVFDTFGSYKGAWFAGIIILIVGATSLITTPSVIRMRMAITKK